MNLGALHTHSRCVLVLSNFWSSLAQMWIAPITIVLLCVALLDTMLLSMMTYSKFLFEMELISTKANQLNKEIQFCIWRARCVLRFDFFKKSCSFKLLKSGFMRKAKLLLENGASVSTRNNNGHTPLDLAVSVCFSQNFFVFCFFLKKWNAICSILTL